MTISDIKYVWSKAFLSALLLCFCTSASARALSDTIIIDQTTLIVQRLVEVDSLELESEPGPSAWEKLNKTLGVFTEVGLTRSSLFSSQEESIHGLTGNAVRSGMMVGIGLRTEFELKEDWWFFSGIHFNRSTYRNTHFDQNTLADSLAFFESFESDQLSQILQLRYEIGGMTVVENDTLNLDLNRDDFIMQSLHIPLGVRYQRPYFNRKTKWTWDIGLALVYGHQLSFQKSTVQFIEEPKAVREIEASDYSVKKHWLNGQIQFGAMKRTSNDQLALSFRYIGETPTVLIDDEQKDFSLNAWSSRLQFALNIFL